MTEIEDTTKSYEVQVPGACKKVKRTWSGKRKAHMVFRDLFNSTD